MHYFPAEFPLDLDICYLNHAAVAPWPRRTAQAVERFAYQNMTHGAQDYPRWMETEQRLRARLAWLVSADSPEDIALVKNTSEGLSFVAAGLDWRPGDQIVGIVDDFPSNRVVWEALGAEGVTFEAVDINAAEDPEQALIDCLTDRTRLLAVSSVHFATGLHLDLSRLAKACRERGTLMCIDAIQSLGALPFDLRQIPADFVVADGHKWMLGPEGLGLLYVNPVIRDRMKLVEFGWAMRERPGDYDPGPWQPARSARRFECGSPNMLGVHALEASLSLLQEIGMDEIERHLRGIVGYLRGELSAIDGLRFITPESPRRHAGILSLRIEGVDLLAAHRALMRRGVICAVRGGNLRLSPHFYTRTDTLDRAVEHLTEVIAECRNS